MDHRHREMLPVDVDSNEDLFARKCYLSLSHIEPPLGLRVSKPTVTQRGLFDDIMETSPFAQATGDTSPAIIGEVDRRGSAVRPRGGRRVCFRARSPGAELTREERIRRWAVGTPSKPTEGRCSSRVSGAPSARK